MPSLPARASLDPAQPGASGALASAGPAEGPQTAGRHRMMGLEHEICGLNLIQLCHIM